MFKPPAFYPMSWAINKTPNSYFFEALTTVKAHRASPDETQEFLRSNPDVLYDLLARVYRGADALLKRLVLAQGGSALSRLVFEISTSCYRFGEFSEDGSCRLVIKQVDLATRTGLARETVSREFSLLQKLGVIKVGKGAIVVPDMPALERNI